MSDKVSIINALTTEKEIVEIMNNRQMQPLPSSTLSVKMIFILILNEY